MAREHDMPDVYRILQIDPRAEQFVLEAAFRALARQYHPDGAQPDEARMAEINSAYGLVRTEDRRRRYDRLHRISPVGPGISTENGGPATTIMDAAMGEPWASRAPVRPSAPGSSASFGVSPGANPGAITLDFGRYAGWRLKDLVQHDPDYLRWLSRHSSGVRYRNQIAELLPPEPMARR